VNSVPELSDLVAADLYAGSALWRHPEINTCILRICYTLGPALHGTLANYLKARRVPTVMGFDPLFQFIHEDDMASAIVLGLEKNLKGVFNVAGPKPVPLSVLIREAGRQQVPVPEMVFRLPLGRLGMPSLPPGAIAHIKFPIVTNADAFRKATGFVHRFDDAETIRQFREACPVSR
jgi:UDP-glucose 4-epimerase